MHRARRGGQQKIIPFLRREGQVIILAARRTPLLPGVTLQRTCMAASRLWAVTQVIDSLRTRKNEAETSTFTLLPCLQKRVPCGVLPLPAIQIHRDTQCSPSKVVPEISISFFSCHRCENPSFSFECCCHCFIPNVAIFAASQNSPLL